jgi:polyferredoxin
LRRFAWSLLFLGWLALWLCPALGVERFPPPEFDSGYTMPPTTVPAPRAQFLEYLDVVVLLATLSAAAFLVLRRRRRREIFLLMLFSLLYFGFYRKGCICPVGSVQDVVLALSDKGYAAPVTAAAFFVLPLAFTLFFGRAFCAAVCPLGAIQDVMLVRPVKVWSWLEAALGVLPFLYLGAAILFAATGSAFIICEFDPFVAFFRRSGSFNMLMLGAGFLLVAMFLGRPYCRFLCPYGALLNLVSRFSRWNVTLTPEDCIHCQLCDVACPFGAIAEPAQNDPAPSLRAVRFRLAGLVVLLPVLMVAGGWLGNRLSVPLSKKHAAVSLAERVAAEDSGIITNLPDATEILAFTNQPVPASREENLRLASLAFRQTGRPVHELYQEAWQVRAQFSFGGLILGAFAGLVLGAKLIGLSLAPKRAIYEPDWAACVACGRCYTYCPKELVRAKRAQPGEISNK